MNYQRQQIKNKLCGDLFQPLKNRIVPVAYTGMENQCTTIYFSDSFEFESIYNLMTDIDSVRQIGGYSKITLYFSSNGGDADCLFALADYLNQISDIEIDFVVTGMVASAGFYILLMIDNPNINIIFSDRCSGLIHLGDTYLSSRGSLSKESERYNWDKFLERDINELNKYFKENFINKLKLRKEDRKRLNQGQDLHLLKEELENVVYSFHERKYYESEDFLNDYSQLENKIKEFEEILDNMKQEYKKNTGKDFTK